MATQTQTAIIVAEYLKSLKIDDEAKKAQLDEAVGLIESALDVDLQDVKVRFLFPTHHILPPSTFSKVFH